MISLGVLDADTQCLAQVIQDDIAIEDKALDTIVIKMGINRGASKSTRKGL